MMVTTRKIAERESDVATGCGALPIVSDDLKVAMDDGSARNPENSYGFPSLPHPFVVKRGFSLLDSAQWVEEDFVRW